MNYRRSKEQLKKHLLALQEILQPSYVCERKRDNSRHTQLLLLNDPYSLESEHVRE